MEYQNRLYMPSSGSQPATTLPDLLCLPGKVAVAMHTVRESYGGLALPETVQGRLRPDCGTVIGVGGPIMTQKGVYGPSSHLKRGDVVLVRAAQGAWFDELAPGVQVRFYGGANNGAVFELVNWWDDIVLVMEHGTWMPTGDNLLVKRVKDPRPLVQTDIWLREGQVIAAGPYADQSVVGCRIAWSEGLWDDVLILDGEGYEDETVVVPGHLNAVVMAHA